MVYLATHEVGFDSVAIGFPFLGDCMGVVVVGSEGLCGWHVMPGHSSRTCQFLSFIKSHVSSALTHLYFNFNSLRRFIREPWQLEAAFVAEQLGYRGAIKGFDVSKYCCLDLYSDTVYVEYRKAYEGCQLFYKRMNKMSVLRGDGDTLQSMQRVTPKGLMPMRVASPDNIASVDIVETARNKGRLHPVKERCLEVWRV